MLTAAPAVTLSDQLMKEIEEGKAKGLMKTIASEIATDPELRALLVQAVLRDVATKEDLERVRLELKEYLEKVRVELKEEIRELRGEVAELRREMADLRNQFSSLMKWMIGLMASMWISIVVGIIVALIKMG